MLGDGFEYLKYFIIKGVWKLWEILIVYFDNLDIVSVEYVFYCCFIKIKCDVCYVMVIRLSVLLFFIVKLCNVIVNRMIIIVCLIMIDFFGGIIGLKCNNMEILIELCYNDEEGINIFLIGLMDVLFICVLE